MLDRDARPGHTTERRWAESGSQNGAMLSRDQREKAWRLASAILSYTLVVLGIASLFTFFAAGLLMRHVVAPGLAPEQARLATNLTRLLLLSPLFLGMGAAFKGMLE